MTLLGVFGGGLWIIPVGLLLGSLWSFYRGYRSSKSNSTTDMGSQGIKDNTGNVSIVKTSGFVFGVILFVAFIASVLLMVGDK